MLVRVFLIALCVGLLVPAQAADKPIGHLQAALELTDNQVTALDNLRQARISEIQKIKADTGLADLRTSLRGQYQSPAPDPMEVGQLNLKIRAVEKLINDARARYAEASRMLLTEAQQKKLRGLRKSLKLVRAANQAVAWGLIKEPRKKY